MWTLLVTMSSVTSGYNAAGRDRGIINAAVLGFKCVTDPLHCEHKLSSFVKYQFELYLKLKFHELTALDSSDTP